MSEEILNVSFPVTSEEIANKWNQYLAKFIKKAKPFFEESALVTLLGDIFNFRQSNKDFLLNIRRVTSREDYPQGVVEITSKDTEDPYHELETLTLNLNCAENKFSIAGREHSKTTISRTEGEMPAKDRKILKLMIDNPLKPASELSSLSGRNIYREITNFCENYSCSSQIQIINWERLGLYPYFTLTKEPVDSPYVIRQYCISGRQQTEYLSLNLTPNEITPQKVAAGNKYIITEIYRPTNTLRLLYKEARTLTFIDKWLLNLKEVMVDEEMGDILFPSSAELRSESFESEGEQIKISKSFLSQLSSLYIRGNAGRFRKRGRISKELSFIQEHSESSSDTNSPINNSLLADLDLDPQDYFQFLENTGFLSTYLDLRIPGMQDYILLLENTGAKTDSFVGGFYGQFPLLELYKGDNFLISRFIIPEVNVRLFHYKLFMLLKKICTPYLWVLIKDKRLCNLKSQWTGKTWKLPN